MTSYEKAQRLKEILRLHSEGLKVARAGGDFTLCGIHKGWDRHHWISGYQFHRTEQIIIGIKAKGNDMQSP